MKVFASLSEYDTNLLQAHHATPEDLNLKASGNKASSGALNVENHVEKRLISQGGHANICSSAEMRRGLSENSGTI